MDEERYQDTRALAIAEATSAVIPTKDTKTDIDYLFETDIFDMSSISRTNSGINSIVDSKTLLRKVKECMKFIKKTDTSDEAKIKIGDFLCNKLYKIYNLSSDKRQIIIRELSNSIINAKESMPIPLRLFFLKFRDEAISYPIAINLFNNDIKRKIRIIPYFQILKYILRTNIELREEKHIQQVLDEFESLFNDDEVSIYTKMEIADIFLLNNRTTRGNQMIEVLRELELNLVNRNAYIEDNYKFTVYKDSQNVHGSDINDSVLKACVCLMEIEPPNGYNEEEVRNILKEVSPKHSEIIDTVLERIDIDTSRFKYKDNMFTLYNVFSSLWTYISKHEYSKSIQLRLVEEMAAMAKYCTTGHLSRFINSIQGYTDDDSLSIRISSEQQIIAVVIHYLDTICSNAPEDVLDSMIERDKTPFYNFIMNKMNDKIPQLCIEYGDVQEYILIPIKRYTKLDNWTIYDNVLSYDLSPK